MGETSALCSPTFLIGFHFWHRHILEFAILCRGSQTDISPTVTDCHTHIQCLLLISSSLLYLIISPHKGVDV